MIKIDNEKIKYIYDHSYGFTLFNMWCHLIDCFENLGVDISTKENVEYRQKIFIGIIEKFLKENLAKLCKEEQGQSVITLPIQEQLQLIENNWPPYGSSNNYDNLDNHGAWFFNKCPVKIAWINQGITSTVIENIIKESFGFSISTLWCALESYFSKIVACDPLTEEMVKSRQKIFIEIIEKLLMENTVKLVQSETGEIIILPIVDQLKLIENNWPPYGSSNDYDDLDEFGLWFFMKCPVGIAWISSDGEYIWAW